MPKAAPDATRRTSPHFNSVRRGFFLASASVKLSFTCARVASALAKVSGKGFDDGFRSGENAGRCDSPGYWRSVPEAGAAVVTPVPNPEVPVLDDWNGEGDGKPEGGRPSAGSLKGSEDGENLSRGSWLGAGS